MSYTKPNLYSFIENGQQAAELKTRIDELDKKLVNLSGRIIACERRGADEQVEYLSTLYNKINTERLLLSLQLNKLERNLLIFELEATIRP